jgi:hypothetical protein
VETERHSDVTGGPAMGALTGPVDIPRNGAEAASSMPQTCSSCAAAAGVGGTAELPNSAAAFAYVFALGRIVPQFPSLAVEKELAQATGRAETVGLTDREALQSVLTDRTNRYMARHLCWTMTIEGLETYLLHPRDPADYDLLVQSLRPNPSPLDVDVVVGVRGPIAPPEVCNGLQVPMVLFDQIYSFDRAGLIAAIPREENATEADEERFRSTAEELFDRILQLADNAGAADEHRALNYLAVRYPAIYTRAMDAYQRDQALTGVHVQTSRLSMTRKIVDVIFSFTHRQTDVTEQYFVRVDVTEEFPFLVTKLSPFYER